MGKIIINWSFVLTCVLICVATFVGAAFVLGEVNPALWDAEDREACLVTAVSICFFFAIWS